MKRIDIVTKGWEQYALIDSGEGRKLEVFGGITIDRPDPQILWGKSTPKEWENSQAHFFWDTKKEKWNLEKGVPLEWSISYGSVSLRLAFGAFKHIGIFPEHEPQWKELGLLCQKYKGLRVLNLFGYTGAASLVAAAHGAHVTHVDASKQTIGVVKENILLSKLPTNSVRIVCEDALKYAKRLISREETFDVIILDPPAFGRGPKGEIWKIEEKINTLVSLLPPLLSKDAQLVILNGYASGYSARSFGELLATALRTRGGTISFGDVGIQQKGTDRIVTTGIYAKWQR